MKKNSKPSPLWPLIKLIATILIIFLIIHFGIKFLTEYNQKREAREIIERAKELSMYIPDKDQKEIVRSIFL